VIQDECVAASRADTRWIFKRAHRKPAICLFLGTLWLYGFFLGGTDDHTRAHMSLTRALAGRGTVIVDEYVNQTHDLAYFEGHYYIAKPPGFAFTVTPVWWLLEQFRDDLVFKWRTTTFLFAALPGAASIVVFYFILLALGSPPDFSLAVSSVAALGTGTFAYSTLFLETPLQVLSLLSALLILLLPLKQGAKAFAVGLLVGYAILLHYIVALALLPVAIYVGTQFDKIRSLLIFVSGLVIPLVGVPIYNYWCFGNPFLFGHFRSAVPQFQQHHEEMIAGLMVPRAEALWGLLFSSSKGLFIFSPFLVIAVVGLVLLWRQPSFRTHALLYGGIFTITFLLVSSLPNWQGGMLSGPRYLLPVVPVLALGMAGISATRTPRTRWAIVALLVLSAAWSIGIWSMLAIIAPFSPEWLHNPLIEKHLPDLMNGRIRPTVASVFIGIHGWLSVALAFVPAVLLHAAAWKVSRRNPGGDSTPETREAASG
jgi:hypothetical protein